MNPGLLLETVAGSRAYGLDTPTSDTDIRGIFLAPTESFLGLERPQETQKGATDDTLYYELGHFLRLALAANPSMLEMLYSGAELATAMTNEGLFLRENAWRFLSKKIHSTYTGYARGQYKAALNQLDWKRAMHSIRVLNQAIGIAREYRVVPNVGYARPQLMEIRRGEWTWTRYSEYYHILLSHFDACMERTTLPDEPDRKFWNDWLVQTRNVRKR